MKNRMLQLAFALLIGGSAMAQTTGRIGTHDAIAKWTPSSTTAFSNVQDGRRIAQEIIDIVGLKPNFDIREANIPNAAAVVYGGKRYILYNPTFIKTLERQTGTKWAAISVLAHEIGHHLNGHTISGSGSQPTLELDADEFSGFVLRKMGAPLKEAQAAMKTLATVNASRTHPGQYDRLTAIADGWDKADAQLAGRKWEPKQRTPVATPAPSRPVVATRGNTNNTGLRSSDIIGKVRFNADQHSAYYVTSKMNLVKVQNNQLSVIGKLTTLNNQAYPYMIYDNETQLLVDRSGKILTRQGRQVGLLTNA